MKNNEYESEKTSIRMRAEAAYDQKNKSLINDSGKDTDSLIYELQVHQIELEMQNEELKKTQVELDKTLDKYFELYDLAPAGYLTMNAKGLIVQANLTIAALLELSKKLLVRVLFSQFVLPDSQDQYYLLLNKVINTGKEQTGELHMKNNGPGFFANLFMVPVLDDDQAVSEIRVVVTDITNIKNAQYKQNKSEDHIRYLNHQLLKAQENERQAISSHLHENVAQDLAAIKMGFENLLNEKNESLPDAQHEAESLFALLNRCIGAVRDLSYELWPPLLDQLGLVQAIRKQCAIFSEKTGLPMSFSSYGMEYIKLDRNIRISLFRIVQEGLHNIRQHALAKNVEVELICSGLAILLNIFDNGIGFDTVDEQSREAAFGIGLQYMKERAASIGGDMRIISKPGAGCKITVEIPLKLNSERL
uniref:Oxygen sensor histidine kinase NreB n=1 Tax=uncultured Desulfobacterium sp. TaxID=201089 RepID=E1YGD4_9BACT|nr:hypothetical protein N47_J06090 [uncultured Desulfobacterium sp.]